MCKVLQCLAEILDVKQELYLPNSPHTNFYSVLIEQCTYLAHYLVCCYEKGK